MTDATNALKSITPKKREQIHISFMSMLSVCQLRTWFRYGLGIRRPPSAYLHVGTAVDSSVTRDLQNKIDTGELLKRDDAIEIAAETFKERVDKEPIELDPDEKREGKPINTVLGEANDKAVALAGLHYDTAAQVIQPFKVQRKFSINMDGWLLKRGKQLHADAEKESNAGAAKILHAEAAAMISASRKGTDFAGEQDIVEKIIADPSHFPLLKDNLPTGVVIRDTKTSGKSPTKSYLDGSQNPGIADDSDQLTTYSLASLVLDGKIPDLLVLDYLVYTPARHDTKYVPTKTSRTMEDINVLLYRFARAVHSWHVACKTGSFLPAKSDDWQCSERYCGYFAQCPAAKRPKLIQITK